MQPQQPFGAPKQPLRPTASQNPFLAQRPVTHASSAMPTMQAAAPRPMAGGPMVGNPMVGNSNPVSPLNPAMNARPAAPAGFGSPAAPAVDNGLSDDLLNGLGAKKAEAEPEFGNSDSIVAGGDNEKKMKMLLYTAIGCGVLALVGIVVGALGLMKKPEVKVETKVESVVDNDAAWNIVRPYTTQFSYMTTVLDSGLTEAARFALAYENLSARYVWQIPDSGLTYVNYGDINYEYEKLFGYLLPKSNIDFYEYGSVVYETDDSGIDRFAVTPSNAGGSGFVSVTRVKGAEYTSTEGVLDIEVYHDNVPICGASEVSEAYCISPENINDRVVDKFVEDHESMIPVYTMEFKESNGGYVLSDVIKPTSTDDTSNDTTDDTSDDASGDLDSDDDLDFDVVE